MSLAFPLIPEIEDPNNDLYFVMCDYGPKMGRAYVDADPDEADRETVMAALISGQYSNPVTILAVNTGTGLLRDATAEISVEIAHRLRTPRSRFGASFTENIACVAALV